MSLPDDLNGLFDDVRPPFVSEYFPYEREITAVYEGRKAMAMYDIGRSLIAESDGLYQGVMSIARSLDLEVITDSSAHDSSVTVFVVRAGEQWRAKAYSLMWSAIAKASSPNSDVIEILSSMLLGYADEQIRTWIDYSRWARLGWCGETVYLWMSDRRKAAGLSIRTSV